MKSYYTNCAFFFKKFDTDKKAFNWFVSNYDKIRESFCIDAFVKNFCLNVEDKFAAFNVCIELATKQKKKDNCFKTSLIFRKDAHASAFQIYSLLAFDKDIASACGILPKNSSLNINTQFNKKLIT
jgi:hypothetical protein